jgi:hypothetical protein
LNYTPKPINTSNIELPASMHDLTEKLAEHIHDIWSQKRMAEGWVYGLERNDKLKTHPDLIPYADLSDSEKEYDRASALESIKAIIALGYKISKP